MNKSNFDKKSANPNQVHEIFENKINIKWIGQGDKITGYLQNLKPHKETGSQKEEKSCLLMYFITESGDYYKSLYYYQPYFYIIVKDDIINEFLPFICRRFEGKISNAEIIEKNDLAMINHLSGIKRKVIKLNFMNTNHLVNVRNYLRPVVQKNNTKEKILSYNELFNPSNKLDFMDYIEDLREDDVPYHVRVCIDKDFRCGLWYEASYNEEFGTKLVHQKDKLKPADLRILAFDLETTKAPLKFPDPKIDNIMLISYMCDGIGYLITNRSVISEDINDFEYTPKAEMEGYFTVFNEPDEKSSLERFISHCKELRVNVFVTYNGDFFDIPFIQERLKVYGKTLEGEFGITNVSSQADAEYIGRFSLHMDCLYWVKRDAFLPQGSHGLKAVTKAKLGYDPIEIDPEKMLKYAKEFPQQLAAYSVSDALATYWLYKLMIHDFIYALCTIIPTYPDEVLRKGSGTLCEELLMAQAFKRMIIFPNKQVDEFEQFSDGHLIDTQTYIGGHVECLNVGVYRSDIPIKFKLEVSAYEMLIDNIEKYIKFCIEIEHPELEIEFDKSIVQDYDNLIETISNQLKSIINNTNTNGILEIQPLIYHLDVSAMYPNIILTNRLQPVAIVNEQTCAGCIYNKEENNCKRKLNWKWRGELFPLSRSEYENLKHQYEFELLNKSDMKDIEELSVEDHRKNFLKRIKNYCSKTYKQIHMTKIQDKEDTVCMRENSFYVDTVRDFRDRRYEFKNSVKIWKGKLEDAKKEKNFAKIEESKNLMNLYESLQLAHKIILNSFYGYVMRKGSRWMSMEMAAMVTHLGSNIIMQSRELVEKIGKPLELDTDGIWCCLPLGFPENYSIKLKNGSKINFSFPCTILNALIYDNYKNTQYQTLKQTDNVNNTKFTHAADYETRTEMSIFFEVDGPYKCMFIPAAKEEGKMLKKRYAVFNKSGKLHELKGFELKRRGELKLVKIFQSEVFEHFLHGNSLIECYSSCARVADRWYSILENKGEGITDEELLDYIEESRMLSRSVEDYGAQKSTSITCAKRIGEILGVDLIKDKGLNTKFIISKKPMEAPIAERAIPSMIFFSDAGVKRKFLQKWLKDFSIADIDMRDIIDWEYYKERLGGCIQKIIIIPAALQKIDNPYPKIEYSDWVKRMMKNKVHEQKIISNFFYKTSKNDINLLPMNQEDQIDQDNKLQVLDGKSTTPNKLPKVDTFIEKKSKLIQDEINVQIEIDKPIPTNNTNILKDFKLWLEESKAVWNNQIIEINNRPKNDIIRNGSKYFSSFGKSKEQIFKNSIVKIIQIIEGQYGNLKLWVIVNNHMEQITLNLKRKIYINSYNKDVPDVFIPSKMTLPRNKPISNLFEFELDEKEFTEKFNNFNDYMVDPNIEGVYESKIPLLFKCILDYGCQIKYKDPKKQINALNMHTFNFADFEPKSLFEENYLSGNEFSIYYLYHSSTGSRHFFALFFFQKQEIFIYIVNKVREMQIPNVKKIIQETLEKESSNLPSNVIEFKFTIKKQSVFLDIKMAIKEINNEIRERQKQDQSVILALQSPLKTSKLQSLGLVSLMNEYPILDIPFNHEDNELPPLDWIKYSSKKLAIRYIELDNILSFRLQLSKYCNIPFCNIEKDYTVFCSDILFARQLRSTRQILWYSSSGFPDLGGAVDNDMDFLGEIEFDYPKINSPGVYVGYSAEIDLNFFCINTILESEHIKDISGSTGADLIDPKEKNKTNINNHYYTLERDEFVLGSNAFYMIKKMVDKFYNDMKNEIPCADILIVHFYRWISSYNSKFYDPVLNRMILKLMQKFFTIFVRKIKEFGFKIIYADFKKIIVFNNKTDFGEFQSNLEYLFKTIKKIPLFENLSFVPNTYWKILIFKDSYDYGGIMENESQNTKIISRWSMGEFLPKILEKDFISIISDYILKINKFVYQKDEIFVESLLIEYNYVINNREEVIELINSNDNISKFKLFLIHNYISNKLFDILPNIVRKQHSNVEENREEDPEDNDDLYDKILLNNGENLNKLNIDKEEDIKKPDVELKEQDEWEFPSKLGCHFTPKNLPLEYLKYVTEVLSLDEEMNKDVYKIFKNCLKILKVEEFSKETEFIEPCRTFVLNDVVCEFCSNNKDLDLCRDKTYNNEWICDICNFPFDKKFIEYLLIQKNQDLKCSRCKLQKNEFMYERCECGGEYVNTFEESIFKNTKSIKKIEELLLLLNDIASHYELLNLKSQISELFN